MIPGQQDENLSLILLMLWRHSFDRAAGSLLSARRRL